MHIEHKAGDKMQVDYTGNRLEIVDLETGELRLQPLFSLMVFLLTPSVYIRIINLTFLMCVK